MTSPRKLGWGQQRGEFVAVHRTEQREIEHAAVEHRPGLGLVVGRRWTALLGMGTLHEKRLREKQADSAPESAPVGTHEFFPLDGVTGFVCGRHHCVTMAP